MEHKKLNPSELALVAAYFRQPNVVADAVRKGARITRSNLYAAICREDIEYLRILLTIPLQEDSICDNDDDFIRYPTCILQFACRYSYNPEVLEMIIQYYPQPDKWSSLCAHEVVTSFCPEKIRALSLLRDHGLRLDACDCRGRTPLFYAMNSHLTDVVAFLLENTCD